MENLVIVRGGGDIATGTIYKLVKSGFHVLILEITHPSAIRRNVAFSEAVYEGKWQVEDMTCYLANDMKEEMKNNTSNINNISNSTSNVNNFTQVINAPKQPSRLELYRQTRNLLNLVNA